MLILFNLYFILPTIFFQLYQFCKKLKTYNKSLIGNGTKETLYEIKKKLIFMPKNKKINSDFFWAN